MNSKKLELYLSKLSNPKRFRETCMPQEFSLSMPIMKYIWTNPSSPKVYQKLIQSCKIFFIKNPVLIIPNLTYRSRWYTNKKLAYCEKNDYDRFIGEDKEFNLNKIKDKIWVEKSFQIICDGSLSHAFAVLPKMFRPELEEIDIRNQNLSFNELKLISNRVKKCWLRSNIRYENGELVALENIISIFSKNTKLGMDFGFSGNAFCRSYANFIQACNAVKEVDLRLVPNTFDLLEFYRHLKNSKSHAVIKIYSDRPNYDQTVQIVDEILNTQFFDFLPPLINVSYLNALKFEKIRQIHENEVQKYYS